MMSIYLFIWVCCNKWESLTKRRTLHRIVTFAEPPNQCGTGYPIPIRSSDRTAPLLRQDELESHLTLVRPLSLDVHIGHKDQAWLILWTLNKHCKHDHILKHLSKHSDTISRALFITNRDEQSHAPLWLGPSSAAVGSRQMQQYMKT